MVKECVGKKPAEERANEDHGEVEAGEDKAERQDRDG